jgi:hypothetical protein
MLLAALTEPMIGDQAIRVWLHALAHSDFTKTVSTSLGAGHGWLAVIPLAAAFFVALGLGLSSVPAWNLKPRDLAVLAGALAGGATTAVGVLELATAGAWTRYPTTTPKIRQMVAML